MLTLYETNFLAEKRNHFKCKSARSTDNFGINCMLWEKVTTSFLLNHKLDVYHIPFLIIVGPLESMNRLNRTFDNMKDFKKQNIKSQHLRISNCSEL